MKPCFTDHSSLNPNQMHSILTRRILMKMAPSLALCVLLGATAPALKASPVERVLLENITKKLAGEALEKTAQEAAEKTVAAAVRALGREGAEAALEHGGMKLLKAGVRYGDEIWAVVKRVPESAHFVAAKPAEALQLAAHFGDDALRLESRLPGMTQHAVDAFGSPALKHLAQVSPEELTRLLGYAQAAKERGLSRTLFNGWKSSGPRLLGQLDKHKGVILATGLTAAALDAALHAVGGGGQDAADGRRGIPNPGGWPLVACVTAAGLAAYLGRGGAARPGTDAAPAEIAGAAGFDAHAADARTEASTEGIPSI
jgi:hypothetical protein